MQPFPAGLLPGLETHRAGSQEGLVQVPVSFHDVLSKTQIFCSVLRESTSCVQLGAGGILLLGVLQAVGSHCRAEPVPLCSAR